MKSPAIAILVLLSAPVALPAAVLTGLWEFDDQTNPGAATVGVPLSFAGAAPGTWSATLSDDQADSLAGVLTTPPAAAATRFIATHGIAPNGGGAYVNEYSVLVDLFSPAGSRAAWRTIFQTNENNTNDADYFINPTGNAGVGALTYSPAALDASSWTRLVVTFDLESAGPSVVRTYLNGLPFHTHALSGGLDGRFALDPTLLFFTDEDGDNAPLHIGAVATFSGALSEGEVAALGTAGAAVVPEPQTAGLLAAALAGLAGRRRSRVQITAP